MFNKLLCLSVHKTLCLISMLKKAAFFCRPCNQGQLARYSQKENANKITGRTVCAIAPYLVTHSRIRSVNGNYLLSLPLFISQQRSKFKYNTNLTITLKTSTLLKTHRTGMNFPNKCRLQKLIIIIIIILIIIIIKQKINKYVIKL